MPQVQEQATEAHARGGSDQRGHSLRPRRQARLFLVQILLGVLFALAPLANATPPDPVWIEGIYDAADYDDVVLLVTSTDARLEAASLPAAKPFYSSSVLHALAEAAPAAVACLTIRIHGPPLRPVLL